MSWMSEITSNARVVIMSLNNGCDPVKLWHENQHYQFDHFAGSIEFFNGEYVRNRAQDENNILCALFGSEWSRERQKEFAAEAKENTYEKERAPEGMPQWEFDLLNGQ
jgi:hypothetical protein